MSTIDTSIATLARSQHGCFNGRQIAEIGATRTQVARRLDAGTWITLDRGVYALTSSPPSWHRDVMAAVLGRTRAIASGATAAALHGLPGFGRPHPELSVPMTGSARSALATIHRRVDFSAIDRTIVDGISTASVAESLFDIAFRTHPFRLRRAVDHALVRGLTTADDLHAVLDRITGSRLKGTPAFREVLDGIDDSYVPTESDTELLLERALGDPRLPPIECQARLPWWDEQPHRVDAYIDEWRLIIEADGRIYHTKRENFESDRRRDNIAAAHGYRVLRFTYEMLSEEPHIVLRTVLQAGAA